LVSSGPLLGADVHLAVADLQPEASPPVESGRLLDFRKAEQPAVEGARLRDGAGGDGGLHVVGAGDHSLSASPDALREPSPFALTLLNRSVAHKQNPLAPPVPIASDRAMLAVPSRTPVRGFLLPGRSRCTT